MPRSLGGALAMAWLAGCGYPSFTATLQGEQVVTGAADGGTLSTFAPITQLSGFDLDMNDDFMMNHATRAEMVSVKASSAKLDLVSPSTQDFSFLDDLQLVATAADHDAVFADKSGIAGLNLKAPTPTLQLDTHDVELSSQLASPAASIVMRGHGRYPPGDTRIHVTIELNVQVKK
jgi:hypothetical protein